MPEIGRYASSLVFGQVFWIRGARLGSGTLPSTNIRCTPRICVVPRSMCVCRCLQAQAVTPEAVIHMTSSVYVWVQIGDDRKRHTMSLEADVVTALQVKEGLVGIVNIRPEQQCLSKQKEDLADCAEISLQDQQGVCVLEMVPLVSLVVLGMSGDFLCTRCMRPCETFAITKAMLRAQFGQDHETQRLVLGEKILRDSVALGDVCRIFELRPDEELRVQYVIGPPPFL